MSLGLYLHIPYCFSKCRYCDFYSHPGERGVPDAYVDALLRELDRFAPERPLQPDTLYFGGGTPSLLRPEQVKRLIDVLGMIDQWWDFAYTVNDVFKQQGLDLQGCNYVPLGLTIDEGMENQWHTYGDTLNQSSGVSITTSCKDPDKAAKFLNDVLDQEIHNLRFWGVEGVDYLVDDDGMFYRTDEMGYIFLQRESFS